MQYRFNAIKNKIVRLILEADIYNIYDKKPVGIQIETREHEPLYWLDQIEKDNQNKIWFKDWLVPDDMSIGLYDLIWTYDKTGFGNLHMIVSTLSIHDEPTPQELNKINELNISLFPSVVVPNQTKFIDIIIECPTGLSVIPQIQARILDYFESYVIKDWTECMCVDYSRFRLDISDITLKHTLYQIEAKLVANNFEVLSKPHIIHLSHTRSGIDKIL